MLPPTLILHGERDTTVPLPLVQAFCARATEAGRQCRVQVYPGQTHGFFQKRQPEAGESVSLYRRTLDEALDFAGRLGLVPPRHPESKADLPDAATASAKPL